MSSPEPARNPQSEPGRAVPERPLPTVAELTAAVQQAAETVAQASAGCDAGPECSAGSAIQSSESHSDGIQSPPATISREAISPEVNKPVSGDASCAGSESPAEEAPAGKRSGLGPRWSYVITRGVVVASVWAFFSFAFDPLMQYVVVQSMQKIAAARVDVGTFSTELFPPRIHVQNLAVASREKPLTNLIEFATLNGEVDGLALMKKSFIFNRAELTGLRWGTARTESGALEEDETEHAEQPGGESDVTSRLQEAGQEWVRELLDRGAMKYDPKTLETYILADQFEREWKNDFDDLEQRVDDIGKQAKQLKGLFESAKSDPLKNLSQVDQIVKGGLQLKERLKRIQSDVGQLPPKARLDLNALNEARQRDMKRLERDVKDLVLNEDKLSEFLLGPQLFQRVTQTLAWLKWADERVARMGSTESVRTRGENISFDDRQPLPAFLARLMTISGEGEVAGDHLVIQGTVADVTNDPALHGRPTIVRLKARGEADVQLHAVIDRTRNVPSNELNLTHVRSQASREKLGDDGTFAVSVDAESTRWTVSLNTLGDELSGTIKFHQKPVRLQATVQQDFDERLRQIIESAVSAVDEVQATVTLSGTVRRPEWKLRTTLGRQISRGVQRGMQDAILTQKAALIARVDSELQDRQQVFLGHLNGRYEQLAQQLRIQDELLKELSTENLIQRVGGGRFDPRKFLR